MVNNSMSLLTTDLRERRTFVKNNRRKDNAKLLALNITGNICLQDEPAKKW